MTDTHTQLATIETTNVPTIVGDNPFTAFADAVAPRHILGKLLKFQKGDWLAGEFPSVIPVGTKVIVGMDLLLSGWVCWQGGKPIDHRMVYIAKGVAPPRRAELGDHDRDLWEKDAKTGEVRDPWALTKYLPMVDESGEVYTFTTSTRGGISAIGELCRHYGLCNNINAGKFPKIELDVGAYQHSNSQFGRIKFPVFKTGAWEPKDTFFRAIGVAGEVLSEPNKAAAPKEPTPFDDDVVPF